MFRVVRREILTALALTICAVSGLEAQDRPEFPIGRTSTPPKIDADLGDEVWQSAPLELGDWVSYNPLRGEHEATCARKCASPTTIATSISPSTASTANPTRSAPPSAGATPHSTTTGLRMSLDSAGTGQTAYHLFVNPSGIQMDALNTAASGEQFEADLRVGQRGQGDRRRLRRRDPAAAADASASPAATKCGWASCSSARSAAPGCSYSWPDDAARASGSSRGTLAWCSRI